MLCEFIALFNFLDLLLIHHCLMMYKQKCLLEDTSHFGAEITPSVHLAENIVLLTENYLLCYGLSNLAQRPIFFYICG